MRREAHVWFLGGGLPRGRPPPDKGTMEERVRMLRRVLADMHPVEAMELLTTRLKKSKSNAEFLFAMNMT